MMNEAWLVDIQFSSAHSFAHTIKASTSLSTAGTHVAELQTSVYAATVKPLRDEGKNEKNGRTSWCLSCHHISLREMSASFRETNGANNFLDFRTLQTQSEVRKKRELALA
ncbi:hypothetical protein GHT06_009174 [Daphnia sinensis]|uniref:Uncharacterized protein n=1 Tax=Daphnia sinensis TaxID=1820382 RepID=A0AAD5PZJ7_9CRUS|nr:hypothetical protein GHT06_009174 [Daphnia sinensis]